VLYEYVAYALEHNTFHKTGAKIISLRNFPGR